MRIEEKVIRKFIADDGKEFLTKIECEQHEMACIKKKVGHSKQYVLTRWGHSFYKFRQGHNRLIENGGTSNVKYAKKFDTFEEAYKYSKSLQFAQIMTIEEAKIISEKNITKQKIEEEKEQRYIRKFRKYEKYPVDGEYITDLGVITIFHGVWSTSKSPEFWMVKVNKNTK